MCPLLCYKIVLLSHCFLFAFYSWNLLLNLSSVSPFCFSQFDITTLISSLTFSSSSSLYHPTLYGERGRGERGGGGEGLRSMLGLRTQRAAAGWIGVIDQAQSICSARLLGLCGWRLFLNYYRRQMLVRRCSLSRLDCFSAAWLPPSLSPSVTLLLSSSS